MIKLLLVSQKQYFSIIYFIHIQKYKKILLKAIFSVEILYFAKQTKKYIKQNRPVNSQLLFPLSLYSF